MGLLDNLQDPNFLYPLVAQLMQARKGQEMQALGQGLLGGVVGQQRGALNASQIASEEQQRQMHALTMDQMKRQGESASLLDSIAKRNYTPGMPQMQPTDYETPSGPAGPGSFNVKGYMSELPQAGSAGVSQMLALQQAMQKDSPFGKVDADKFTPESLRAFMQSGGHDFSLLQPRTKVELNGGVAYDPFGTKPGSVVLGPSRMSSETAKAGSNTTPRRSTRLRNSAWGSKARGSALKVPSSTMTPACPLLVAGLLLRAVCLRSRVKARRCRKECRRVPRALPPALAPSRPRFQAFLRSNSAKSRLKTPNHSPMT
jgi:hypothetical protein